MEFRRVLFRSLPAKAEEAAGRAAAEAVGLRYETVRADCSALGSGDLAGRPAESMAPVPEWWPFRNQLILTIAGAVALHLNETELMIGALRTDGVHADGRPEFIEMISALMQMQEGGLRRSEEHTSELQSLMRNSYAVFCL